MSVHSRKRPIGISLLSAALGWLAIAGFGNAVVWHTVPASMLSQLSGGAAVVILRQAATPLLSALAFAYGATALYACVSLWRMRPVAVRAFLWWSLTVVAVFIFFLVNSPRELRMASLLMVIVVALFLWALLRYVLRAVSPSL